MAAKVQRLFRNFRGYYTKKFQNFRILRAIWHFISGVNGILRQINCPKQQNFPVRGVGLGRIKDQTSSHDLTPQEEIFTSLSFQPHTTCTSHMKNRRYKTYCHFGTTGPNLTVRRWDESVSSYPRSHISFVGKSGV